MISERDLGYDSDNLLNYYAGPIKISINGYKEKITLSTTQNWKHLLKECFEISKSAWEIDENNTEIEIKELEITIKYNINIISLYIEYSIIFL